MKKILFILIAISNVYAFECYEFAGSVASMSQDRKVESAKLCKERFIDLLQEKIQSLDKSTDNCQAEMDELKSLVAKANEFYRTAITELKCQHPDPAVENRMQTTMVDLIYALNEKIEERKCDHLEYVETKADAQVEMILLQETKVRPF